MRATNADGMGKNARFSVSKVAPSAENLENDRKV
jgi:hypothetical protein